MKITEALCDRIVAATTAGMDAASLAAGRRLVLDGIAVAIAGARTERCIQILAGYLREQESKPEASALGMGFGLAMAPAALLNGAAMHVLDFEPMWKPATHALSTTLPAVLALAEVNGANGRDVLTALIKGIEIQGWLRQASKAMEPKDFVFHQPGMVGPIGSAVASAHMLGLDVERLANAIGIATSRCSGLIANSGTMTKSTHCGYAASLGLESALLAARGFTGNMSAFDAPQGYVAAFFPKSFDGDRLLRFGPPYRVVQPGYALKAFPCKYQTHYAIVCGLAARPHIGSVDTIRAARMTSPIFPAANRPNPKTGLEAKFSIQFCLAAALLDGAVGISTFTDERLARTDVQALLPKIDLTMNPDIPAGSEGRYVEVEIDMVDGRVLRQRCEKPPGSWGAPSIPEEQYLAKIRDCLATFLTPEASSTLIDLANNIDSLHAKDVERMIRLASGRS